MRNFLICCLLALTCTTIYAQQDYLISIKGDTLYGETKILTSTTPEQVQLIQDKNRQTFHPLQAREFTFEGNTYRSVKNYDKYQFMILMQEGFLGLYAYRMDGQSTYDGRLLVKKDGTILDLPNIAFKRKIASFLSDCPDISEQIEQSELGRNDIELIITTYNECLDAKTLSSKSPAMTMESQPAFDAAKDLLEKIQKAPDFENKADAIAMLDDIKLKLQRNEKIPGYLQEALKSNLSGKPEFEVELKELIKRLQQ